MKQLTQSEIRKNGKVYKNVSSPATEGTMKQVTDIVEKDGTFSISTDGGKTYSPAVGAVPEALPQEASALKSGSLPTSGWTTIGISTEAAYAYTISDTDITENSDILMELTDEGGVKAQALESGKITVIRDTVPTQPISYTYKVKQTNASGQFTLVNHYVPNIPVTSVNGQTGAVTIAVPTKTSELTNDSGFLTKNNIVAGDNVTVTDENGNVKISATGGVTYTKLIGSVDFTATEYTDDPYFLEQNAATWSENSAFGIKALTSTTDIRLFIGTSYYMEVNIQGTSSMFSAEAEDGSSFGIPGSKVLWFKRADISSQFLIYDHCTIVEGNIQPGDGCIFFALLDSDITIATIHYFSGYRGVITPVTITNSAIKINSAVTMYINSSLVVSGTKTDGNITLTTSTEGSVSYEMEILNTSTEGLFEVINAYLPRLPSRISDLTNDSNFATTEDIPVRTSQLQNDSGFVKKSGTNTFTGVQIFDNPDGIITNRVHSLGNNDAWYNFDGANNMFGSPSRPTIISTSEARPRAQVPSGKTTVTKALALLEDVPAVGEWVDVAGETATLTQAGTYQFVTTVDKAQSIMYWDGTTAAIGTPMVGLIVNADLPEVITITPRVDADGRLTIHQSRLVKENDAWVVKGSAISSGFKYRKIN